MQKHQSKEAVAYRTKTHDRVTDSSFGNISLPRHVLFAYTTLESKTIKLYNNRLCWNSLILWSLIRWFGWFDYLIC